MARFITMIISAFVLSKCSFLTALQQCSTDGVRGLSGCKCSFMGACNAHETHSPGLNISHHLPKRLKLYGYWESALIDRNLAYLCKGETVAILFDCNSHIPLYAATLITGSHKGVPFAFLLFHTFRLSNFESIFFASKASNKTQTYIPFEEVVQHVLDSDFEIDSGSEFSNLSSEEEEMIDAGWDPEVELAVVKYVQRFVLFSFVVRAIRCWVTFIYTFMYLFLPFLSYLEFTCEEKCCLVEIELNPVRFHCLLKKIVSYTV